MLKKLFGTCMNRVSLLVDRAQNFPILHHRAVQGPNHPLNTERSHIKLNLFNVMMKVFMVVNGQSLFDQPFQRNMYKVQIQSSVIKMASLRSWGHVQANIKIIVTIMQICIRINDIISSSFSKICKSKVSYCYRFWYFLNLGDILYHFRSYRSLDLSIMTKDMKISIMFFADEAEIKFTSL